MAEKNNTFFVGVNVFILRRRKLLLGKRKNVYGSGTWALPGGHLKHAEEMKHAAARELFEETGMRARGYDFVNLVNDPHTPHYLQIGFIAKSPRGEPRLKEPDRCFAWKWFDLGKLPKKLFKSHRKQITLFVKRLGTFSDHSV